MSTSALPYQQWIDQALREVIRQALRHAEHFGLPGQHHYYITFRTGAEGVQMSPRLRAQHSDEMTIVLQHQFWDLAIDDEAFSVTLKFGGKRDHLRVPFQTITGFADPAVNFALQFKPAASPGDQAEPDDEVRDTSAPEPAQDRPESGSVIPLDTFRKK